MRSALVIQRQPSPEAVAHYLEVAQRLMQRYDWQLLSPEQLVEQALDLISGPGDNSMSRGLVGAYCPVLYQAFLGEQGPNRQQRACHELAHVLSSFLLRDYPGLPFDERGDVVQNTLERIWRARDSCREPAAFLAFASYHLLTAVQYMQRQLRRLGEPITSSPDDENDSIDIPDESASLLLQVLAKEHRADIVQFLAELRQLRPRASDQIDVLELRLIEDLDYPEIAQRLKISRDTAYQRLSRILKTIHTTPELAQHVRELGLH